MGEGSRNGEVLLDLEIHDNRIGDGSYNTNERFNSNYARI